MNTHTHTHFFSLEPANEALQPAQDENTWEQFMGADITNYKFPSYIVAICRLRNNFQNETKPKNI